MTNKYYQKHKERHQKKAPERDQNLPEEEKDENNKIHGLDLKILRNMKCFMSSESFLP